MDDRLKELAMALMKTYDEAYNSCYINVVNIFKYQIEDINTIEKTLDQALDIYTEKGMYIFLKLWSYYRAINYQNACEYLEILKEDRGEEYHEYMKKIGKKQK